MAEATSATLSLSPMQIEVIAAGLYQLAACDGVDEQEIQVIREFLEDTGASELIHRLPELNFDPAHAYRILETSWLRGLFLKAAYLLIKADGKVTDEGLQTLDWMCSAFGIQGGAESLESQLKEQSL